MEHIREEISPPILEASFFSVFSPRYLGVFRRLLVSLEHRIEMSERGRVRHIPRLVEISALGCLELGQC